MIEGKKTLIEQSESLIEKQERISMVKRFEIPNEWKKTGRWDGQPENATCLSTCAQAVFVKEL